ncbi:metal-dependent hydrolase, partial [Streptomyces sp. SID7803]|nr:metal-dependent hydrolase [Streptomyces sp. SID7803]
APELAPPLWKELTDIEPGGPTYPAQDPPVQRIDYVAVSKDTVRVRSAAVAETLASDHRPVVADLSLRR